MAALGAAPLRVGDDGEAPPGTSDIAEGGFEGGAGGAAARSGGWAQTLQEEHALGDEDMDLRDQEAQEALDEHIVDELEQLLLPDPVAGPSQAVGGGQSMSGEEDAEELDEAVVAHVAAGLAEAMAEVDNGEGASQEEALPNEGAGAPPVVREPWMDLGPVTALGYVYDSTPRSVLRIQRGKPKNSVTINCYLHTGCRMLLTEARCPDDDTLKRWLFEVPAPTPGMQKEELANLAQQHMSLGKGRWGAPARRARG